MKKLITAILAAALILTSFSSAFAAVSIDDVFVDADGTHFFFGRFDYSKAEDAGVEVNGKAYSLNLAGGMDYNDLPQNLWSSALRNGRFGVGLKDSKGIVGDGIAEVKPYEVIDGEKVYGEAVSFDGKSSKTPVGDEIISSITVGEDELKGVDSSIFEYYYGLDELPETAEGLPAVTVVSENEAVVGEAVAELGGFTKTVTVNCGDDSYEYNIYFRKTETVTLSNTKLLSAKGGYVRNDNSGYANIVSNEYGYAEFSADAITGTDCIIIGASLNANFKYNLEEITIGVSAYDSADMLISDVGPFLNRDFKTFRTAGSVTPESKDAYYDVNLDYSKFRTDSNKIVLVMKKASTAPTYLYSPKLTISYVKKNPGMYDATLKEIKVDGVDVKNFDPNVYEYYVGVEDPDAAHEITAISSYSESEVTVSGNIITVKPVVGESKTYTLNLREVKTVSLSPSARFNSKIASKTVINLDTDNNVISTKDYGYNEFDISALGDIVIDSAELEAIFQYNYEEITVGNSIFDGTFDNKDFSDFTEIAAFTPVGTLNKKNLNTVELDNTKITINNGKILIVMKKKTAAGATYATYPVLNISYLEKVSGATDATLSEIKLDGVALEDFDSEVTEYYYGVDSLENLPEISATATATSSQVTVSGNIITVKPLTGESKVYTINFREIQTLTVTASDNKRLKWNGQTKAEYLGPSSIDPTSSSYTTYGIEQDMVMYQLFDLTALPENAVITDAEIVCDVYYSAVAPTTIYWNRSVYDTFEAIPTTGYHKEFSARWTEERKPVQLGSFTVEEAIANGTHTPFTSKLDTSELNVVDGKIVLAATKGFGEENSTSPLYISSASDITIKYIVK